MESLQNERIVIKRRGALRDILSYGFSLVLFAFLLLVFAALLLDEAIGDRIFAMIPLTIFAIGSIVSFFGLLRQVRGGTAIFDGRARTVTVKQAFGKTAVFRFEEIARIAPILSKSVFFTREGFCIVPAADPVYGTKQLTSFYKRGSKKLAVFRTQTLPKIESMLGLAEKVFPVPVADYTAAGYSREMNRYVKSFARRQVSLLLFCILLLIGAGKLLTLPDDTESLFFFGMLLGFFSLIGVITVAAIALVSLTIDPAKRTLEIRRGLLLGRTRTYAIDSLEFVEIGSFYGNWLTRNNRLVSLQFQGMRKPLRLSSGGWSLRKKVNAELEAIVSLKEKDLITSFRYKQTRVGNGMFGAF